MRYPVVRFLFILFGNSVLGLTFAFGSWGSWLAGGGGGEERRKSNICHRVLYDMLPFYGTVSIYLNAFALYVPVPPFGVDLSKCRPHLDLKGRHATSLKLQFDRKNIQSQFQNDTFAHAILLGNTRTERQIRRVDGLICFWVKLYSRKRNPVRPWGQHCLMTWFEKLHFC